LRKKLKPTSLSAGQYLGFTEIFQIIVISDDFYQYSSTVRAAKAE